MMKIMKFILKYLNQFNLFFTNEKECDKKGNHWEKIGFQSKTPKSDLRSVGMLAPLQILYFLCAYPSFSLNVYRLFLDKNCEWLFAVTLINITQICYHLLRDDLLDNFFYKKMMWFLFLMNYMLVLFIS